MHKYYSTLSKLSFNYASTYPSWFGCSTRITPQEGIKGSSYTIEETSIEKKPWDYKYNLIILR